MKPGLNASLALQEETQRPARTAKSLFTICIVCVLRLCSRNDDADYYVDKRERERSSECFASRVLDHSARVHLSKLIAESTIIIATQFLEHMLYRSDMNLIIRGS